jgi:hypothetical protein
MNVYLPKTLWEKKEEIYMDMLLKTPLNPMEKFKEKV